MSTTTQVRVPSVAARRSGYAVAAGINVLLLVLINGRPGWEVLSFLTPETTAVLAWVNASLIAGVIVNLGCVVYDPRWFVSLGAVATTAVGAAALVRLWQIFPFDFGTGPLDWTLVARTVLVIGIVGSAIGMVVQMVSLLRAFVGDRR